jgi:hypothetical protein
MSKKTALALAAIIAIALPTTAFGQIGIGARAGTLGLGGEVSFGLGSRLGVRGGVGVIPGDLEATLDEIDYTLNPPSRIWNIGLDVYPFGGGLRLSAGLVNRPAFELSAVKNGTAEIGGTTYTGQITINGDLGNERETAPFVAIGFGKTYSRGFGLFIDLGAAHMGDPDIALTGSCKLNGGTEDCPNVNGKTFQQNVDDEATRIEEGDDARLYLKWHPILQIGLKMGFGS